MSNLSFLNFEQLKNRYSGISWIVKNLIPADATGILFGETGSYKSFIAIDLSLHIAHGLSWCGYKTTQGSVFFIAGEGGAGLYRRIEAWHQLHGLSPEASQFFVCPTPIALNEAQNSKEIMQLIKERAKSTGLPRLIVIDTLSQNFSGLENDSSDIADYMRTLIDEIRVHFQNSSILLIHHTGHVNKQRMRGAYSLKANADFVYLLEGSNLSTVLKAQKMKDCEIPAPLLFRLEMVELGRDMENEPITSLTPLHVDKLHISQSTNNKTGKHTAKFFKAFKELGNDTSEAELLDNFLALSELSRDSAIKAFNREISKQKDLGNIKVAFGRVTLAVENNSENLL